MSGAPGGPEVTVIPPEGWFVLPRPDAPRRGLRRADPFVGTARAMAATGTVTRRLISATAGYLRRLATGAPDALLVVARVEAPDSDAPTLAELAVFGPVVVGVDAAGAPDLEPLARGPAITLPPGAEPTVEPRTLAVGPAVRAGWTDGGSGRTSHRVSYAAYVPALGRALSLFGSVTPGPGRDPDLLLADLDTMVATLRVAAHGDV